MAPQAPALRLPGDSIGKVDTRNCRREGTEFVLEWSITLLRDRERGSATVWPSSEM